VVFILFCNVLRGVFVLRLHSLSNISSNVMFTFGKHFFKMADFSTNISRCYDSSTKKSF